MPAYLRIENEVVGDAAYGDPLTWVFKPYDENGSAIKCLVMGD